MKVEEIQVLLNSILDFLQVAIPLIVGLYIVKRQSEQDKRKRIIEENARIKIDSEAKALDVKTQADAKIAARKSESDAESASMAARSASEMSSMQITKQIQDMYKDLSSDMQLEMDNMRKSVGELKKNYELQIEPLKERIRVADIQIQKLKTHIAEYEAEKTKYTETNINLQNEISSLEVELHTLEKELSNMEAEIARLKGEIVMLKDLNEALKRRQ